MQNKKLLVALLFPLALAFTGCEKAECEEEETGTLTLKNTRSSTIKVNVKGDVKNISSGSTGTFNDVPSGTCEADITFNGTTYTGVSFSSCVKSCGTTELQY
jgi:hypothetical protein